MSDVESEAEDAVENPNPESDLQAAGPPPYNDEVESDEANSARPSNCDVDSTEVNVQATVDDGRKESAENNDNAEGDVNNAAEGLNEENQAIGNSNELNEDEINPSGLLAEGDQHQHREAGGIGVENDLNNSNDLAAEDEQYLVQDLAGAGYIFEPESDIRCPDNEEGAVSLEASKYGTVRNSRYGSERTESSSQLDDFVTEYDASSHNISPSRARTNSNQEVIEAEGACASGQDDFLEPESELGEIPVNALSAGADESVMEDEPTESDQEVEDNAAGTNEPRIPVIQEHIVNQNVETLEAGASEPNLEENVQDTDNNTSRSNLGGESVQSPEGAVPEDEMNIVASANTVTVSESFQPECDQSDMKACENHSSHDRVDACSNNSPMQETASSSHDTSETLNNGHTDIEGNSASNVTSNCQRPATKGEEKENINGSMHFQNINLSKEKGAIPKHSKTRKISDKETEAVKSGTSCDTKNVDSEDELLSELDATLSLKETAENTTENVNKQYKKSASDNTDGNETSTSAINSIDDKQTSNGDILSCEQCMKNNLKCSFASRCGSKGSNSNIPGVKDLKGQLHQAKKLLLERECEISRLKSDLSDHRLRSETLTTERDADRLELDVLKNYNSDDLYIPQIKELEYTIAQQQNEIRGFKEKLSSHDASAKRAISTLQHEMKLRVEQVTKQYEEANREKDSMVVKFAQAEHKNLECQKQAERAENKVREMEKERATFFDRMKVIKDHRNKVASELEAKNTEATGLHKELDKQRELLSSSDIRVKWAQNKLKAELEAHKDTKTQLDKMHAKIMEAKEETQQIRRDCQAIIKTYQESEEVKSNSLDKELKQKESELLENQLQKNNFELAHVKTQRELEAMRGDLHESQNKLSTLTDKLSSVEAERDRANTTVDKYGEIIQKQKKEIQELRERVESLVQYKTDFISAQEMIKSLDTDISDLKITNKELVSDMDSCRRRESDKLELTAKLSRKNAELQSEHTTLSNKVLTLTGELQAVKMENQDVDTKLKYLADSLASEQKQRQEETQTFNTKLAGKCKAVEDLSRKLDDEKDEIKTLKRKHVNNMKDLTRQLQQVRRKLETYEASTNGDKDTLSLGSRTSSNGSLNTVGIAEQTTTQVVQPSHAQNSVHRNPSPEQEYPVITEQVEVDKQTLIERIVKHQKTLARKNEKIEFMDDHINQLVDEIQKKNKIIQSYILKEESGTMTSDLRDKSKAEISRKHSIMGSVYSSHSTDGTMTLDLSLEINRKLQAVLEDTLLKNMTLKESLDTLGQEIARLSQENRKLQLQIHGGKSRSRTNPSTR